MNFIKTLNFIQSICAHGLSIFNEINISKETETSILTYNATKETFILEIYGSGQVNGEFIVKIDSNTILKGRTTSANLDWHIDLNGKIRLINGQTLQIFVKNLYKVDSKFNCTLILR